MTANTNVFLCLYARVIGYPEERVKAQYRALDPTKRREVLYGMVRDLMLRVGEAIAPFREPE